MIPRRRREDRFGWVLLIAVLSMVGFYAAVQLAGCASPMVTYYRTVATTATGVRAGYVALDKVDDQQFQHFSAEGQTNPTQAKADRDAWVPKYNTARKALEATDDVVTGALREGPALEGLIADKKSISKWIDALTVAASAAGRALADAGVNLPIFGGK